SIDRRATGREIGGTAQVDYLILLGNGLQGQPVLSEKAPGAVVGGKLRQSLCVSNAATGIAILALDQLCDGARPITGNAGGNSLCARHHFAVYHQHAVIPTL